MRIVQLGTGNMSGCFLRSNTTFYLRDNIKTRIQDLSMVSLYSCVPNYDSINYDMIDIDEC